MVQEWAELFQTENFLSEKDDFMARESGKCEMLRDISELEFSDIELFYEENEDVETSMGKSVSTS